MTTIQQSPWWRSAVIYQIYPRSFADSNGDGVGDVQGIIDHLDHLVALGVDAVWLSPVYQSPMEDNGYDISDYQAIDPLFGDLETFDHLVAAMHERGLKLIMDLVVNHTSDQHEWFKESRSSTTNPKRDWYHWLDPKSGVVGQDVPAGQWRGDEPNTWRGFFDGPTWQWDEATGQYYLHLFAPGQPDLNWENPQVRQAIYSMIRWWLDRGVDGFRLDVINLISKPAQLVGEAMDQAGSGAAFTGSRFHEFMAEMHREAFDHSDKVLFSVGETPGITLRDAELTSDPSRRELDMVFQFDHVGLDSGASKFDLRPLHLPGMKKNMFEWSELCQKGWNSLYLGNHDQPRYVSRWGDEAYREASSKAWAAMLHAHPGTPFIYQGDELGMTNAHLDDIADYRDVESLNAWRQMVTIDGGDPAQAMAGIAAKSRDNARTPVQWDASEKGGFTTGKPWIGVNPNTSEINAASQVGVDGSVFEFHRQLCELRHTQPILTEGSIELLAPEHEQLWLVRREYEGQTLTAVANMSSEPLTWPADLAPIPAGEVLLANYDDSTSDVLNPWEVRWILS